MKVIIVLVICVWVLSLSQGTVLASSYPLTPAEQLVMRDINQYRLSKGLTTVHADRLSCALAAKRAVDITSDWSHDRFYTSVPNGDFWTENLARRIPPPQIVAAWIQSPKHNKNLLADTPFLCAQNDGSYWAMNGHNPHPSHE